MTANSQKTDSKEVKKPGQTTSQTPAKVAIKPNLPPKRQFKQWYLKDHLVVSL